MLIKLYLFLLALGAVLLGASLFFGDTDTDTDFDVDADADMDFDGDHDLHGLHDISGADLFFWPLRSIRFWTFFATFFGASGLILDGLDLLGPIPAVVVAVLVGAVIGFGASNAIRWLATSERGGTVESGDYIGRTGKILVPVERGSIGKIRIALGGNTVDVLAKTESGPFNVNDEAMIFAMDDTVAKIIRVEDARLYNRKKAEE